MNLVPPWVWLLGMAVCLSVGLAGGIHYEKGVAEAAANKAALKKSGVVIEQQSSKITQDAKTDATKQKVDDETARKLQAAQSDATRLAAANGSLRSALAAVRADALSKGTDAARLAKEAAAATDALSECSAEYGAVAKEFDECSVQLSGWQALFPSEPASSATSGVEP